MPKRKQNTIFKDETGAHSLPRLSGDRKSNYELTDLIRGSITFNIVTKEPFAADEISNNVFYQLSGYREWFKEKGVHKMDGLSVGKESIAKIDASQIELTVVPVSFNFTKQETVTLGQRLFNGRVYKDGVEIYENIEFVFSIDGTKVTTSLAVDADEVLTIDYVDAITLNTIEGAELVSVGNSTTEFTVPNNGGVYGFYKIAEDILINDITVT